MNDFLYLFVGILPNEILVLDTSGAFIYGNNMYGWDRIFI